jgi:hypothetical protein
MHCESYVFCLKLRVLGEIQAKTILRCSEVSNEGNTFIAYGMVAVNEHMGDRYEN